MDKKFLIGIVGATGYTGLELLRLLLPHPKIHIHTIVSRTQAGQSIGDIFQGFNAPLYFENLDMPKLKSCDVVFYATPHQFAMTQAGELIKEGIKVIDLSADFRLQNARQFEQWYGCKHSDPDLLKQAVYGLTELYREKIRDASLIANPGCYPTSIQLPLSPLLNDGLIETQGIIIDSKSGVSGAGKTLNTANLYTENNEDFKAYGVNGHRHLPEIEQGLNDFIQPLTPTTSQLPVQPKQLQITFVPHLLPLTRGIESTIYCRLKAGIDLAKVYQAWHRCYTDEPFIRILQQRMPTTKQVRGTNLCVFTAVTPQNGNTLVISSVIDNLTKGASGQAVQNMNLILGIDEKTGLQQLPL